MGWRSIDIDRLIIGDLIGRGKASEGARLPAPASGASEATMPADTDVSGHPPRDQRQVGSDAGWRNQRSNPRRPWRKACRRHATATARGNVHRGGEHRFVAELRLVAVRTRSQTSTPLRKTGEIADDVGRVMGAGPP